MTEQEFKRLKQGYHVKNKDGELYKIMIEDVWGPPDLVFLAQACTTEFKQIQISEGNFRYWERVYL